MNPDMRVILVMASGGIHGAAIVTGEDAASFVRKLKAADTVGQFQICNCIAEPASALLDYVREEDQNARGEQ